MITEAMWAAAREASAEGMATATRCGWRGEAREVLGAVDAAMAGQDAGEAHAVIGDQMRVVAADPNAARGLHLERVLQQIEVALTTAEDRAAHELWAQAVADDMAAFLAARWSTQDTITAAVDAEPVGVLF